MSLRSFRKLRIALIVVAILGAFWYGQQRGLKAVAVETHDALCTLKQDIAQRQQSTKDFLADVRSGAREPIAGISNVDLQRSIDNQQATLDALASLRCG